MSALRDYACNYAEGLERIGVPSRMLLPYKLLAEYGEDAVWSPLPDGEEYGYAKQCFGNATTQVLFGEGLTYYEGLVGTDFTVPHAWAQDADGRVYDITLRHNDTRCPFCHGDGELHPTDHYDYYGDGEEYEDDAETVECEMCGGTGEAMTGAVSREGTAYLGIPIPTEVLRAAIMENEVYGVLFEDPERVEKMLRAAA